MKFQKTLTQAEIEAKNYAAALDSVEVINRLMAITTRTNDQDDEIARNVGHLRIVLDKGWVANSDITPITAAIELGKDIV